MGAEIDGVGVELSAQGGDVLGALVERLFHPHPVYAHGDREDQVLEPTPALVEGEVAQLGPGHHEHRHHRPVQVDGDDQGNPAWRAGPARWGWPLSLHQQRCTVGQPDEGGPFQYGAFVGLIGPVAHHHLGTVMAADGEDSTRSAAQRPERLSQEPLAVGLGAVGQGQVRGSYAPEGG